MIENDFISSDVLGAQESLNTSLLKQFECKHKISEEALADRPVDSYQRLMLWAEKNFSKFLHNRSNLNKFVHNRIIIDGAFMQFAKENNVNVECLYKDSIISWSLPSGSEKFFVQGIFLVKAPGVEFLHCALFHKGNQNEDEVSFFIIVSEKDYSKYIELRNKFDSWSNLRDRSNCSIRVMGGDDILYDKNNGWDELILSKDLKSEIKGVVENFLSSKDFYLKNKIPWKTGLIFWGTPGCGKSSLIKTIISNYNFKPVTITPTADDNMVREAFSYAEDQSPALLYFEDLDSLLERNIDLSSFLNLMDGVVSRNGIMVVATANDFSKLKPSITDRPSRFDRKFEIPLPNQEMAYIYLNRWFGKTISVTKAKSLAKIAAQHKFSYAYLKELYISSMFEALSKNKKAATEQDIDNTMKRLIKDKSLHKNGKINTEGYFV